ncbi:MAG: peptidase M2 family protein [Gammaproteobacteria bacterium]|nr:MAG: peptidase M2 family protein [Gammaproteobacteria bacterium]
MKHIAKSVLASLIATVALVGCGDKDDHSKSHAAVTPRQASSTTQVATTEHTQQPTVDEARAFIQRAEQQLATETVRASRAAWVAANFITVDTQKISAEANERLTALTVALANEAKRFNGLNLPETLRRKLEALKLALTLPAPADQAKTKELATLASELEAMYGSGKYCKAGTCRDLGQLSEILATSDDPAAMLDAWVGWRTIATPMKPKYQRLVELANEGAQALGYADLGVMWRSKYDMPPDAFAAELDRLWEQVKPLYTSLHCYVRGELNERYGDQVVPPTGPIPAHLLGNMWAQHWGNIYDKVKPDVPDTSLDLTQILRKNGYDFTPGDRAQELAAAKKMVRTAENFFVSLGFEPLPKTFWERSLFLKPRDRDVVCHASAWDIDNKDDVRIKMCIKINGEDFVTIHHELGHNFYQRAYQHQSPLFQGSANDGFHEAAGDLIALSITPEYLRKIDLIDQVPDNENPVPQLMRMALEKVAFLPFGLLVDKWRWQVFSGELSPATYNDGWWKLREYYQGIKAPVQRPADAFDPGAKYHIPANTPYARYFLAHILQFQWHRDLCRQMGYEGPLYKCSIYGNKEVGAKIQKMFAMGMSRPWPEALEVISGTRRMDASALLEYFEPLKVWLDAQNQAKGRQCGW